MAVLSRSELLRRLNERLSTDTSDEVIGLIEDVDDTIKDFELKSKDATDWKQKYEQNDEQWRTKYRERFYRATDCDDDISDVENTEVKKYTYEELFREEKK